ncbi:hypothetical protein EOD42_06285 [Rhodovarius crocodyli]|uniref:Uncharacterized protein n=1 Tax=Rhodovarius crocodyli TaxID=1979269 RepID=A0A437MII4_9PROT|nr:hypothetical protein [Rhodovarius crocodyli]RVT97436.1 hypothetical protein EOD42_06285 [Rhodovarius crocodyli]
MALVDSATGEILRQTMPIPERLEAIAISPDSRRALTLIGVGSSLVEYDLTTGQETGRHIVRAETREEHLAFGFHADGRVLVLVRHTPLPDCCLYRLLAVDGQQATEVGRWTTPFFQSVRTRPIEPDGTVRLFGWSRVGGGLEETVLVPGHAPIVSLLNDASLSEIWRGAVSAGARTFLVANSPQIPDNHPGPPPWTQPVDDVEIVDRPDGGVPTSAGRAGLRTHVQAMALSADGQTGAFIASDPDSLDYEPVLHIVTRQPGGRLSIRRSDVLSSLHLGRTSSRTRVSADALLSRLHALARRGIMDRDQTLNTLGLWVGGHQTYTNPHSETFQLRGTLSPTGFMAVYRQGLAYLPPWRRRFSFRLQLDGASPCLTADAVRRVFGEPGPDTIPTGIPGGPYRQPRFNLTYRGRTDRETNFTFFLGHCAHVVEMSMHAPVE